jgi:hypothetical protein
MNATHYPELARMKIASDEDTRAYLTWLARHDLSYHLDDNLDEIIWGDPEKKPTSEDVEEMKRLDVEMWRAGDPWRLLEDDRELWKLYTGRED